MIGSILAVVGIPESDRRLRASMRSWGEGAPGSSLEAFSLLRVVIETLTEQFPFLIKSMSRVTKLDLVINCILTLLSKRRRSVFRVIPMVSSGDVYGSLLLDMEICFDLSIFGRSFSSLFKKSFFGLGLKGLGMYAVV